MVSVLLHGRMILFSYDHQFEYQENMFWFFEKKVITKFRDFVSESDLDCIQKSAKLLNIKQVHILTKTVLK